jgi:hypothetical protein
MIDNGSAGFTAAGSWQHSTASGHLGDTHWIANGATSATAAWNFTGLAPGQYRLAATWPASRLYATDALFSIRGGGQTLGSVRVNQQRAAATFSDAGIDWQNLGTFTVTGNALTVQLNGSTTGRAVADAVRLERVYSTSGGTAFRKLGLAGEEFGSGTVFVTALAPEHSRVLHEPQPMAVDGSASELIRGSLAERAEQIPTSLRTTLNRAADDAADSSYAAAVDELCAGLELTRWL